MGLSFLLLGLVVCAEATYHYGVNYNKDSEGKKLMPMICTSSYQATVVNLTTSLGCESLFGRGYNIEGFATVGIVGENNEVTESKGYACWKKCITSHEMCGFLGIGKEQHEERTTERASVDECDKAMHDSVASDHSVEGDPEVPYVDSSCFSHSRTWYSAKNCKLELMPESVFVTAHGHMSGASSSLSTCASYDDGHCLASDNITYKWEKNKHALDKWRLLSNRLAVNKDGVFVASDVAFSPGPVVDKIKVMNWYNFGNKIKKVQVEEKEVEIRKSPQGIYYFIYSYSNGSCSTSGKDKALLNNSWIDEVGGDFHHFSAMNLTGLLPAQVVAKYCYYKDLKALVSRKKRFLDDILPASKSEVAGVGQVAAQAQRVSEEAAEAASESFYQSNLKSCLVAQSLFAIAMNAASDQQENNHLVRHLVGEWYVEGTVLSNYIFWRRCSPIESFTFVPQKDICYSTPPISFFYEKKKYNGFLHPQSQIIKDYGHSMACSEAATIPILTRHGPALLNGRTGKWLPVHTKNVQAFPGYKNFTFHHIGINLTAVPSGIQTQAVLEEREHRIARDSVRITEALRFKYNTSTEQHPTRMPTLSPPTFWDLVRAVFGIDKTLVIEIILFVGLAWLYIEKYFLPSFVTDWIKPYIGLQAMYNIPKDLYGWRQGRNEASQGRGVRSPEEAKALM